jgi:hypothetical protein
LGADIRTGQILGNIYAQPGYMNIFPDTSSGTTDISNQTVLSIGGWPSTWPSPPYQLGANCLIIQQPAFYNNTNSVLNGAPLMIPAGTLGASQPANLQYVDTVVYYVLPDPDSLNQFMIQRSRFSGSPSGNSLPGLGSSTQLRTPIDPPQTMLRGVVGPISSAGSALPSVFQYLTVSPKPSSAGQAQAIAFPPVSSPVASQVLALYGVAVNLEIETPVPNRGTSKIHHFGSHSQFFLRSNSHIRMSNTGASY